MTEDLEKTPAPAGGNAEAPADRRADSAAGAAGGAPAAAADDTATVHAQVREHRERSLRLAAELENVRRRAAREVETSRRYALEGFAAELLPVLDSLELAFDSASEAPEGVREGLAMTLKLLRDTLGRQGVEPIAPAPGEAFDPKVHEAMATQPSGEVRADSVLTLVQKGYRLYERLLRPARVIVSRGPDAGA